MPGFKQHFCCPGALYTGSINPQQGITIARGSELGTSEQTAHPCAFNKIPFERSARGNPPACDIHLRFLDIQMNKRDLSERNFVGFVP